MIPRGNIISETYREYVEWREDRDLVDGSELGRRVSSRIVAIFSEKLPPFNRPDVGDDTRATEIRIFGEVLGMLDELKREAT